MGMIDEVRSKNKLKAAHNWIKMAENAKDPGKQVEYYTKALDANPYNAEAWFRKGRILEGMGNFEEAKRCFDLAVEIDDDYLGLIGRKQYGQEASVNFTQSSASMTDTGQQTAGQWGDVAAHKSEGSFTSPLSDESIFSDLRMDHADDIAPISNTEDSKQSAGHVVFSQDEADVFRGVPPNVSSSREARSEMVQNVAPDVGNVRSGAVSDIAQSSSHTIKAEKARQQATSPVSSAHVGTAVSGQGGSQTMDIRIPLNESLKFWAIGFVVILIALKLSTFM